MNTPEYYAPT